MALILVENENRTNFIIDFADSAEIDKNALNWAHFYMKINIDENINYNTDKLHSIGPSFGINFLPYLPTIILGLINFIKSFKRLDRLNKIRRFFSNYKSQLLRPKLKDYYSKREFNHSDYVFFAGSVWKKEVKTNYFRANFIKACRSNKQITFEGGFAPRVKKDVPGFEDLTIKRRIKMSEYIKKMLNSKFAFNTPAVLDCHGWKLGEFLCMGKAIISTPISRKLPQELVNGEHLIVTDGTEIDINKAINKILNNDELYLKLQTNAREYYLNYLSPEIIANKIKTLHNSRFAKAGV